MSVGFMLVTLPSEVAVPSVLVAWEAPPLQSVASQLAITMPSSPAIVGSSTPVFVDPASIAQGSGKGDNRES